MSLRHSLLVVALVTASVTGIDESNPDFDISLLQVDLQQQVDFTQVENRMENGRIIGQASGGWYAGAEGESCDSSCEALGLVCANNEHNAEVDTADEVKSLISQVGGETDCTDINTGCDYQPGSWKAKGTCWYCASPTTSDCGAANEKRQRLCYCDQATTTTTTIAVVEAAVVYEVHGGGEPCTNSRQPETLDTSKTCHEFGKGRTHYNSLKVIRCSSQCLCFNQLATVEANPTCDESVAEGSNIKEACFNTCMPDCNGPNCATDPDYDGTPTALKLTGSGDICSHPVPDADYFCDTTGMVGGPAHPSGNTSSAA